MNLVDGVSSGSSISGYLTSGPKTKFPEPWFSKS
jgi:hypothetical protein